MAVIAVGTIRRLIKGFFPEDKISKKALERLVVVAEDFVRMSYIDAKKYSEAGGRKIVIEKDVILSTS